MTTFRSDELLVGIVALALLPLIGWRVWRGLKNGQLPVYRTRLHREDSGSKFAVLLTLHALAFLLVALVAADLLLGLRLRERL